MLLLTAVLDLDVRLTLLGEDLEGEVLQARPKFGVIDFMAIETIGVKDTNESCQSRDLKREKEKTNAL